MMSKVGGDRPTYGSCAYVPDDCIHTPNVTDSSHQVTLQKEDRNT